MGMPGEWSDADPFRCWQILLQKKGHAALGAAGNVTPKFVSPCDGLLQQIGTSRTHPDVPQSDPKQTSGQAIFMCRNAGPRNDMI